MARDVVNIEKWTAGDCERVFRIKSQEMKTVFNWKGKSNQML